MSLRCNSEPAEGPWRRTLCLVNHPIFRPGAEAGSPRCPPEPPARRGAGDAAVGRVGGDAAPRPQVVFTVTLDVPHGAELGAALELVANASR